MTSGLGSAQKLAVVPYIGVAVPSLLGKTIYNTKDVMLSFSFVPIPYHSQLESTFGYSRNLATKSDFPLTNSSSSLMNMLELLVVSFIFIPLLHLSVYLAYKFFAKRKDSWLKRQVIKANGWFAFNFYVRFIMLIYMFVMLTSFHEVYLWVDGEDGKIGSRLFSLIIFILCVGVIIFTLTYWFKYADPKENGEELQKSKQKGKFSTLFSGVKPTRIHRLHAFLFFLKRFLLCFVIFLLQDIGITLKLILILVIQLGFFIWS